MNGQWAWLTKWPLLPAAVAVLVMFSGLGATPLLDEDEPKNAACAQEMFARGDWIVPTFNQELRTDKPILIYWQMLLAYNALGVSEFTARGWSALWGICTVLVTYFLGRRLFGPATAFWAGLILATCLMFVAVSRAATPDATLIFFTTTGLAACAYALVPAAAHATGEVTQGGSNPSARPHRGWLVGMYLALGFAVLAKGPVGVVLPVGVAMVWLLLTQERRAAMPENEVASHASSKTATQVTRNRFTRALRAAKHAAALIIGRLHPKQVTLAILRLGIPWGVLIVLAVALPWYAAVTLATDGDWLTGFLGKHNVSRFLKPMDGHRGPIVYYIPAIMAGCFPWSLLLPATLIGIVRRARMGDRVSPGQAFLLCWLGTYVIFFSFARTKLPSYVLPAYPAIALILGGQVAAWTSGLHVLGAKFARLLPGAMAIAGIGIALGLGIAGHILMPGLEWLSVIGVIPLAIAGWIFWKLSQNRPDLAFYGYGAGAVALAFCVFVVGQHALGPYQNAAGVAKIVRSQGGADAQVGTFECYMPGVVFYTADKVAMPHTKDEVVEWFTQQNKPFLLTRARDWEWLQERLPQGSKVVYQRRRFLRKTDLILVTKDRAGLATMATRPQTPNSTPQ